MAYDYRGRKAEVRMMQVVQGIYDGRVVRLLEPVQVEKP